MAVMSYNKVTFQEIIIFLCLLSAPDQRSHANHLHHIQYQLWSLEKQLCFILCVIWEEAGLDTYIT